ncbi:DUF6702 family protein [Sphingobacterium hotanense]|uniref:Orphan protein n=1 Tax=Sphingobacterium hotanense TaxID=649196 RepID=A0ABT7NK51_9SPHI|nr:DUF6702 family protein [Sphingobacterium hotanense]MDM1047599.1 hypothetical protein [Sphingobacterium hotanense]
MIKTPWLLLILCLITISVFAHPFYVSISTVDFNSKNKRIEISCRIFYDDLEVALKNQLKQKIDVINPKNKTVADSAISKYIQDNFNLKVNGQFKKLKFVGYEVEEDVAWCYFETPQTSPVSTIIITNQLLYQDFKSQSNILHVTVDGKRQSTKMDNPKKSVVIDFRQ